MDDTGGTMTSKWGGLAHGGTFAGFFVGEAASASTTYGWTAYFELYEVP